MKRVQLRITGRVQGVYYRASTQQQARELGLTGWVRNLPGGAVEAEVQGPPSNVDALIRWCHTGPLDADVDGVDVREIEPVGSEHGFEVR